MAVTAAHYGPPPYNPVSDTISDLQAVHCGPFQGAQVCSPLHAVANLSVAVIGLLMITGSLSLRRALPGGSRRDKAAWLFVIAGLAAFTNAFTPEDVTVAGDAITAFVIFIGTNFGLILIGKAMLAEHRWRGLALSAEALGSLGVASIILDVLGFGTVMGEGLIEWLVIAPFLIWAPAVGLRVIFDPQPAVGSEVPPTSMSHDWS